MPLVIVFVGIPLDYLSMGNTRYVLRLAAKKSSYKTLLLCIFMSLAVFVIAHIALAVGSAMTFSFGGGIPIIISSPSSVVSHKFVE
jgi:hypothetical protein